MTSSPSKVKGTGGEREVTRSGEAHGICIERMPSGWPFDHHAEPAGISRWSESVVRALVTRPDRGQWLASIPLETLWDLMNASGYRAEIEVKRRGGSMWHHTQYRETFK